MKCPKCGSEMFHNVRVIGTNRLTGLLQTKEYLYCSNQWCGHEEKLKDGEKDEK